jgi:hypothetical protein
MPSLQSKEKGGEREGGRKYLLVCDPKVCVNRKHGGARGGLVGEVGGEGLVTGGDSVGVQGVGMQARHQGCAPLGLVGVQGLSLAIHGGRGGLAVDHLDVRGGSICNDKVKGHGGGAASQGQVSLLLGIRHGEKGKGRLH